MFCRNVRVSVRVRVRVSVRVMARVRVRGVGVGVDRWVGVERFVERRSVDRTQRVRARPRRQATG